MPNYPIISFNAGELTPLIDARSDIDKYKFGCRIVENFIPRIYGPVVCRPGTKFIDEVVGVGRIVSFVYSSTIAYILLFEDQRLYFYYDGARVLDGDSNRLMVISPYLAGDLQELQFKQLNDVMWITHPDYPPYKLSRTSATAFTLEEITFNYGPFKKRNDKEVGDDVTMAPSVTTGSGTLTASSAFFVAGHIGALFSVCQPRVDTVVSGSATSAGVVGSAILVEGSFTFTTGGTWEGSVRLERSIDGSTWEHFRTWTNQVQYTGNENDSNVQYRINVLSVDSGTIKVTLTVNSSIQQGICRITAFTSTTVVNMTVIKDFASTDADVRWLEGSWSEYRGYPTCITFFEDRAVYAGSPHQPQSIWFSATGDYEYFFQGTLDDSSFWLTLNSDQRNAIRWISPLEALLLGTTAGEWRLRSSAFEEPITPSNFSIKQQTTHGSKAIQALPVNDVVLFVDFVGRKVREAVLDGSKDKYVAPDLTALAEHITEGGIVAIAHQKNPDSILWSVRDDGTLLSMSYEREQNVVAWARHLGGPSVSQDSDYKWSVDSPVHYPVLRALSASDIPDKPDEPDDTALSGATSITNSTQLQAMTGSGHYELANDIDLTAVVWSPIASFSGILDGKGYTISNLSLSAAASDNQAIFSSIESGCEIRNLTFKDCAVTGKEGTAILAGWTLTQSGMKLSDIHFIDCTVTCTDNTGSSAGCLFGGRKAGDEAEASDFHIWRCSTTNCTVDADVANGNAGSLIGAIWAVGGAINIVDCYVDGGTVTAPVAGGFAYDLAGVGSAGVMTVHSCWSSADIPESSQTITNCGGFLNTFGGGSIVSCYSSGDVTITTAGKSPDGGGFLGGLSAAAEATNVIDSYSNCTLVSPRFRLWGGFIGDLQLLDAGDITITRCFATGTMTCNNMASGSGNLGNGGFIGNMSLYTTSGLGTLIVERCWSTVDIVIVNNAATIHCVGGFIGLVDLEYTTGDPDTDFIVRNCYAWGSISNDGTGILGGFVGYEQDDGDTGHTGVQKINCYSAQTDSKFGSGLTNQIVGADGKAFLGYNETGDVWPATACYWDNETQDLDDDTPDVGDTRPTVPGHTTEWLMTKANFVAAGWDMDTIWELETTTVVLTRSAAGTCKSVATIPSADEDEVWIIIGRTIKGEVRQYLEQMQPRDYGDDIEDAWFVDSGLSYDGVATAVLTGLEHLEGETVAVLGDGAIFPLVVVNSGQIILPTTVEKAIVGVPFQSNLQPMRFDLFTQKGTSKGSIKRFAEAVISFYESIAAQYGEDTDTLFRIAEWSTGDDYTKAVVLETGDKVVTHEGGFSVEDPFVISVAEPVPCVVRCIIPRVKQTGR